ncbi:hypothetical protein [Antrihabitans spumae]|uniref:HPP family protein n=1 Tax=Antrihabitans spumae TaxID=3373370 RepID=A0ABW7KSW5_9NOCA
MPASPTSPNTARIRGCVVGAFVGALAVAAHGSAGGGYPSGTALTLLVIVSGALGATAATIARPGPLGIAALLAGGQLLGHYALSVTADHSHAGGFGLGAMALAHCVATVTSAFLIVVAERLLAVVTNVLRVALRREPSRPNTAPRPLPIQSERVYPQFNDLLRDSISRRGPPAVCGF